MKNHLFVPDEIKKHLSGDAFQALMQMYGKAFRDVRGRKTIQVTLGSKSYFVKQHFGVGWAEIFKNLLSGKRPILGAMTEVDAIQKLDEIGINTTPLIAYGIRGGNPATQQSFVITADLGNIISLEDLCVTWKDNPPTITFKRKLIIAVAQLANTLHINDLCHRDFYLCHLCLDKALLQQGEIKLYLIDLHRMKHGNNAEKLKDIAALYFSSLEAGLSTRDFLRFKKYYVQQNVIFWQKVIHRAQQLNAKFYGLKFQQKLAKERAALSNKAPEKL